MKSFLLSATFLITAACILLPDSQRLFAQGCVRLSSNENYFSGQTELWGLVINTDGTFTVAGETNDEDAGTGLPQTATYYAFLAKINSDGTSLAWKHDYGSNNFSFSTRVQSASGRVGSNKLIATSDGGYALAGEISTPLPMYGLIMKFDAAGTLQWTKKYGDGLGNGQGFNDIVQTTDGGYIAVGYSIPGATQAMYAVKTDAGGNQVWSYKIGGTRTTEELSSIIRASDGHYVIAGTENTTSVWPRVYIAKMSPDFTTLRWNASYGSTNSYGNDVVQTADGGFAVAGHRWQTSAANEDCYVIKLNAAGGLLWTATFGGSGNSLDKARSIVANADGSATILARTASFNSGTYGTDNFLCKVNTNGTLAWGQTIGLSANGDLDEPWALTTAPNGDYFFAGRTTTNSALSPAFVGFLAKATAAGGSCGGCSHVTSTGSISGSDNTNAAPAFASSTLGASAAQALTTYTPPCTYSGLGIAQCYSVNCGSFVVTNTCTPPNVAMSGGGAICNGQSVVITATASAGAPPYTFSWSPITGLSNPNISNPTASPTTTTTYTVTVNDACAATNTKTGVITVTVSQPPTASISYTGSPWCTTAGVQNVTLIGTAGGVYTTTAGGLTINAGTGQITPSTSTAGTYTVTYTTPAVGACSAVTSTAVVTITAAPTTPTISYTGSPWCTTAGVQNVTQTGTAGGVYTTTAGGLTITPGTGQITPGTSAAGTYTVSYTIAASGGCAAVTATAVVTINALPTPAITASPSFTICNGSSTTLTASGGTTYVWSPGGATATSISVNPTTTTDYTVTATANGCSGTNIRTVTVNPLPAAYAGVDYTICPAASVTITTATGNGTFSWSPPTGLSNPNISNPVASPTATTTYTLSVTNSCGTAVSMMTITVGIPPSVNAGPNATICPGGNTTLNASGSTGTYAWSPAAGLSSTTIANPVASPSVTTDYTVTLTASCGTATGVVRVTIGTLSVTISGSSATICNGKNTTLTASGGSTYSWSPGGSTTPVIVVSPTSATTYTVTGFNAGCTGTSTFPVTVNSTPVISVNATSNTICNGQCTTLSSSGGTTYSWLPGGATTTIITVCPTTGTTYTVTGTDGNGCTNTSTSAVAVNATPTITITGTSASICSGQSATLTASGGSTYSWSPGGSTTPVIVVSPTTATTYTVIGTDANGCNNNNNASTFTVTISPQPTVTITGSAATICNGQNTTLTASGGSTYSWSPGGSSTPVIVVNPTAGTTYTVTGTNGCSNTSTFAVTVNATPTVTIISGTTATVCNGQSATLTASGGGTYSWLPGGSTTPVIVVNPTTGTSYTVTATAANGCTNSGVVSVTVLTPPVAKPGGPATLCSGNSAVLTAQGGTIYSWNTGQATSSITVSPSSNTCYTVTVSNGLCADAKSICLTVLPTPTVNAGPDQTINIGLQTTLNNTSSNGSYNWNPASGLSCVACPNPIANPVVTTTYVLTTSVNGCTSSDAVIIYVNIECGDVFIPTGFSPNGDTRNDYATVRSPCLKIIDFTIYNRWGQIVFHTNDISIGNDPTKGWNGYFNDKLMDPAVFYYILNVELLNSQSKEYKGNITLVR